MFSCGYFVSFVQNNYFIKKYFFYALRPCTVCVYVCLFVFPKLWDLCLCVRVGHLEVWEVLVNHKRTLTHCPNSQGCAPRCCDLCVCSVQVWCIRFRFFSSSMTNVATCICCVVYVFQLISIIYMYMHKIHIYF